MTTTDTTEVTIPDVDRESGHGLYQWLWFGLFCLAFAPTAMWLWERWTISIWYSGHGVFMPIILAYLIWDRFRDDPDMTRSSSPLGFLFLIPGLGMLALDTAIGTNLMAAVGLIICLPGLSLLLLGYERTKSLRFALVIASFMLPIPAGFVSQLHLALREITAWGTAQLLPLIGVPLSQDGTTLFIPGAAVEVADACSGFSTMYAALTTALILAHLRESAGRGVLLIVVGIIVALVSNTIRVTALALFVRFGYGHLLDTWLHEASGLVSFTLVIATLFLIAGRPPARETVSE